MAQPPLIPVSQEEALKILRRVPEELSKTLKDMEDLMPHILLVERVVEANASLTRMPYIRVTCGS